MDIERIKIIVKVTSFKDKDGETEQMQAIIALDFGAFKIKGFRIRSSEYTNRLGEKLWLIPPSYQAGGRYHPMFYMEDKKLWEKLEDRIYKEYDEQLMNYVADKSMKQ